jgi:hypothetical protein
MTSQLYKPMGKFKIFTDNLQIAPVKLAVQVVNELQIFQSSHTGANSDWRQHYRVVRYYCNIRQRFYACLEENPNHSNFQCLRSICEGHCKRICIMVKEELLGCDWFPARPGRQCRDAQCFFIFVLYSILFYLVKYFKKIKIYSIFVLYSHCMCEVIFEG